MSTEIAGYELVATVRSSSGVFWVSERGHETFETFVQGEHIADTLEGPVIAQFDGAVRYNCLPDQVCRYREDAPHVLAWIYRRLSPDS